MAARDGEIATARHADPAAGAPAVVRLLGIYALFFGVMMISPASRMRGLPERPGKSSPAIGKEESRMTVASLSCSLRSFPTK